MLSRGWRLACSRNLAGWVRWEEEAREAVRRCESLRVVAVWSLRCLEGVHGQFVRGRDNADGEVEDDVGLAALARLNLNSGRIEVVVSVVLVCQ